MAVTCPQCGTACRFGELLDEFDPDAAEYSHREMTPELVRQLELDYLRWPLWCVVGADDLEMKAVEWAARKTREPQFQAGQPRPDLINIDGGRVTVYPETWPRKVVAALWREALLECGH